VSHAVILSASPMDSALEAGNTDPINQHALNDNVAIHFKLVALGQAKLPQDLLTSAITVL